MNKQLELIIEQFKKSSYEFKTTTQALEYEFIQKKSCYKSIIKYEQYTLIFQFTIHYQFLPINHILECYIVFHDNLYPIYYILDYLNIDTLDIFVIPCISNYITMKQSFELLSCNIVKYKELFININKQELKDKIYKDISIEYKTNNIDLIEDFYNDYLTLMTVKIMNDGYINLLLDNRKSAIKSYTQNKNKLDYEKRILKNLEQGKYITNKIPYTIIHQIKKYSKKGITKTDFKEFIVFIISFILNSILFVPIYLMIYQILYQILLSNYLYIISEDSIVIIILPCFISGIITSYFTIQYYYKFIFRKSYNDYIEFYLINETPLTHKFMKILAIIIFICSVCFIYLSVQDCLIFEYDYILDQRGLFNLKKEYYSYDIIENISFYKTQINIINEDIHEPTYIINMKSIENVNLYEYMDIEECREKLIPFLQSKNINVEEYDIYNIN